MKTPGVCVFVAGICIAILAPVASAEKRFKSIHETLANANSARNTKEELDALNDLSNQQVTSGNDVLEIYSAMKAVEPRVSGGMSLREAEPRLKRLGASLLQAKDSKFHSVFTELIERESAGIEFPMKTAPWDDAAMNLRTSRLSILMQIAGESRNRTALPVLRKIANRQDVIGHLAIRALGQIGDPADLDHFISAIKRNPRFVADLGGFGPALIDRIIREVEDPTASESTKNALLGRMPQAAGPDAIPKLRSLLDHKNPKVAEQAAHALKISLGPGDENVAFEMLRSSDSNVRFAGLTALDEKMWSDRHSALVIESLKNDPEDSVRSHAAHILGQRKVTSAIPALRNALTDSSGFVRSSAEGALKSIAGTYDQQRQKEIDRILKK